MERLTISKGGKFGGFINPDGRERNYLPPDKIGVLLDRLTELEDKLESGQLVELPCKMGDTMYGIDSPKHIEKAKLLELCYEVVTNDGHHLIGHFGISLFTDKSQAEARLKELQEK